MPAVHKIRYGSWNVMIAKEGERFCATIEKVVTRQLLGGQIEAATFDDAVMKAKLKILQNGRGGFDSTPAE